MSRISRNVIDKLNLERKRCQVGDIIKTRKRKFIAKRTSDFEGINPFNRCSYCSFHRTIMCLKYNCTVNNDNSLSPKVFKEIE